jgi:AcrR family transcriptional regulator
MLTGRNIENMQNLAKENKREAILNTAFTTFKHYGYRKTSMHDIATALGISRASLYSYFENKEDIFRCVLISVTESGLVEAKRCLGLPALDLTSRIEAALLARYLPLHRTLIESAHGEELAESYFRLCGDSFADSFAQSKDILTAALKSANRKKEIDLKAASLTASAASELLNLTLLGLRHTSTDVEIYKKRVKSFVSVFMRGLRSTAK